MSQLTIRVTHETAERIRTVAESEGLSPSQWISRLIERHFATSWPDDVIGLVGSWREAPDSEELRESHGSDAKRDSI